MNRLLPNLFKALWPIIASGILAGACAYLVFLLVQVSSERPLTPLESTLFQIVILLTAIAASYVFSQRSARAAAEQLVKPHARSAFRRVKNMYSGLFYLKAIIDQSKRSQTAASSSVVKVIEAVIDQQVNTVVDALEDWRDIVPEEVEDLERRADEHERAEMEDLRR